MSVLKVERTPNWTKWQHVPNVELWEGVALSLDIAPEKVKRRPNALISDSHQFKESQDFDDRLFVASRNLGKQPGLSIAVLVGGHPEFCKVSLPGFAAWASSLDWEVPPPFAKIGEQWMSPNEITQSAVTKWPWGDYETDLLRKLAAAAYEFWSTYDPEQSSTAPKNQEVIEWLISEDVPKRVAEVIARILRADGLPSGPRR